jgi:methylated-DNA-[protein]-cysteine S-methyltransferase
MLEFVDVPVDIGLTLRLFAGDRGLLAIEFDAETDSRVRPAAARNDANLLLAEAARQLREYFTGRLRTFDLPLDPHGTPFQLRVWNEVAAIPYGRTRSYSGIAAALGTPAAVRAVGAANGANPLPIVIPCHRVIGASGKLIGYGGGLPLKRKLLELEGSLSASAWPE